MTNKPTCNIIKQIKEIIKFFMFITNKGELCLNNILYKLNIKLKDQDELKSLTLIFNNLVLVYI